MKKIIAILMTLSLAVVCFTACEESEEVKDVNVKEAPSGSLDVDLSGKTLKSEVSSSYFVNKNEIVYDANGNITSSTLTEVSLVDYQQTVVFNADGTFTITMEQIFTSAYDALYNWTYTATNDKKSMTYTMYDFDNAGTFNRNFDEEWMGASTGDKLGDVSTTQYSGYTGQVFRKTVYSGSWIKYELESDGYDDYTYKYKIKIEKSVYDYLVLDSTDYVFANKYRTQTDTEEYADDEYGSFNISYTGKTADGKNVYFTNFSRINLWNNLILQ